MCVSLSVLWSDCFGVSRWDCARFYPTEVEQAAQTSEEAVLQGGRQWQASPRHPSSVCDAVFFVRCISRLRLRREQQRESTQSLSLSPLPPVHPTQTLNPFSPTRSDANTECYTVTKLKHQRKTTRKKTSSGFPSSS